MSTPPDQMPKQASTMRLPKRLPLVQVYGSRNQNILKDSRLVNAYAEQTANGGWQVEKRPALVGVIALPGGIIACNGFTAYKQWAFYVQVAGGAATLDIISLDTMAVSGTHSVNLSGGMYTFNPAPTGLTQSVVYMGNASAGYLLSYNTTPPGFAQITDSNFPPNAGIQLCWGSAVLDGTLYVLGVNGEIYGSNVDDATTWNALNAIAANADADSPVAIAKHLTYVVALKQWTTNFFYDAGNSPGSPLGPVPDSQVPYGCLAGETLQEIDGNLIWVTTGENVAPQVGRLSNLDFNIVSTPAVDRLLLSGGSPNSWFSWTMKTCGHRFYGVTNYVQGYTLVYDLDNQLWQVWTDSSGLKIFPVGFVASQTETIPATYILAADPFTGAIYAVQPDYMVAVDSILVAGSFQPVAVPVDIYTPSYDAGTRRVKTLDAMYFSADKNPGSILQSRWNDSDYQTDKWSNFRKTDLSFKKPMLTDCGTFSRRAYHFRHQCPTPFRISAVDLQMDIGVA